jgi:pyruvate dehydrogenase E1 component
VTGVQTCALPIFTVAALRSLADDGQIKHAKVTEALKKYRLDPNKPNPVGA